MTVPVASPSAPPLVTGEPVEVADGVFVIPDDGVSFVPNIGVVVGERAALVIDTGIGARNGAHVLDRAQHLADGRPLYLALTQLDPGHGFGAQAFVGAATIVHSAAQRDRLHRHAPAYVEPFARFGPEVAAEFEGLQLVGADLVHGGRLEIDLGGVRAVLQDWGPAHTADDQTVLVDDRVLFGGDLFSTRTFPVLPYWPPFDTHFDGGRWITALDELIRLDVGVVVTGHGAVTGTGTIREVRDYLDHVSTQARRLRTSGMAHDEAAARIEQDARARWSDWDGQEWITHTVRAFSAGLDPVVPLPPAELRP